MRSCKTIASVSRDLEEALLVACDVGDLVGVTRIIKMGANMNMICESGRTPFCSAAYSGKVEILRYMIRNALRKKRPRTSPEGTDYSTDSDLSGEEELLPGGENSTSVACSTKEDGNTSEYNSCCCAEMGSGELCKYCAGNKTSGNFEDDLGSNIIKRNHRIKNLPPEIQAILNAVATTQARNGTQEDDLQENNPDNDEHDYNFYRFGYETQENFFGIEGYGHPYENGFWGFFRGGPAGVMNAFLEIQTDAGHGEDGISRDNPEEGAPADAPQDTSEEDYIEVVNIEKDEVVDLEEDPLRAYVFGGVVSEEVDAVEVASSDDDAVGHYFLLYDGTTRPAAMSDYKASKWTSGIFTRIDSLTRKIPNPKSINKKDHFGWRAIHYAVVGGHLRVLRLLLKAGCKVNVGDDERLFPLHLAAARNISEELVLLINAGAYVNVKTVDKITPLHVAASRGLLENVKILVENGARVNTLDRLHRSPLYMAVVTCHKEVASYLILKGAKLNIGEIHGHTPLFEALGQRNFVVLRILTAAGAKINKSPYLLHYAVLQNNEIMVRELIKAGFIVNGRDENGDTALMVAARTLQPRIVKLLLEFGALVNLKNTRTGEGALVQMIQNLKGRYDCFMNIFALFYKFGFEMDGETGYKALRHAIYNEEDAVAALLIRRGAIVFSTLVGINAELASKLFYEVLLRENWLLGRLFIYAGCNYNIELSRRTPAFLEEWLDDYKNTPLRLTELCRIVVRSELKNKVFERVSFLNIPSSIQNFIKLENVI